ncbi:MAG: response regulator, partial [bacterium]|nr:response regulator [bacterium]
MAQIVIVEDEQMIREELAGLLTQAGYEASYLTEFSNAAEEILQKDPDLILMDVNLPGTNGLMICDQIRKKSQVPIIF